MRWRGHPSWSTRWNLVWCSQGCMPVCSWSPLFGIGSFQMNQSRVASFRSSPQLSCIPGTRLPVVRATSRLWLQTKGRAQRTALQIPGEKSTLGACLDKIVALSFRTGAIVVYIFHPCLKTATQQSVSMCGFHCVGCSPQSEFCEYSIVLKD